MSALCPGSPLYFMLCDYPVALDVPDRAAREMVLHILDGFGPLPAAPSSPYQYALMFAEDGLWEVHHDDEVSYRSRELTDALVALEWHIVTDMVNHRRDRFHLHAASLAMPAVAASVLVAGISGSGKTTLTLGLMARGLLPYSDDVTLIDPDTCVPVPFPRSFHIDGRTRALLADFPAAADWPFDAAPAGYFVPREWAEESLPIRMVLFPTLMPGAAPALAVLSHADAAARLLPFSTTLTHSAALALRTAARIVGMSQCYALTTGDLGMSVDLVIDRLRQDTLP